ncbi:unnamed protein product [Ixodes pacificus]
MSISRRLIGNRPKRVVCANVKGGGGGELYRYTLSHPTPKPLDVICYHEPVKPHAHQGFDMRGLTRITWSLTEFRLNLVCDYVSG